MTNQFAENWSTPATRKVSTNLGQESGFELPPIEELLQRCPPVKLSSKMWLKLAWTGNPACIAGNGVTYIEGGTRQPKGYDVYCDATIDQDYFLGLVHYTPSQASCVGAVVSPYPLFVRTSKSDGKIMGVPRAERGPDGVCVFKDVFFCVSSGRAKRDPTLGQKQKQLFQLIVIARSKESTSVIGAYGPLEIVTRRDQLPGHVPAKDKTDNRPTKAAEKRVSNKRKRVLADGDISGSCTSKRPSFDDVCGEFEKFEQVSPPDYCLHDNISEQSSPSVLQTPVGHTTLPLLEFLLSDNFNWSESSHHQHPRNSFAALFEEESSSAVVTSHNISALDIDDMFNWNDFEVDCAEENSSPLTVFGESSGTPRGSSSDEEVQTVADLDNSGFHSNKGFVGFHPEFDAFPYCSTALSLSTMHTLPEELFPAEDELFLK
mmetsp:Transcript_22078/g.37917  ORF Transcript_22078/g.37917 Transcript_22078/m.37917 type:complete len:432 (-) Transcript_22078:718-2013(-)|eukprot:CAMPEP_0196659054 /NCGR_PEP_ID=MMETSP1086-20130531/32888_1 /TAXON_ID=77921 /ORGANISM="Cyanoptyche  gloeocystis , Strain SAG4.97" /LENGTH=431 /DNA_ID=CAMNT_0041992887 /DNA_START=138 /DNA_END=1433 /DNA_ORIENTATION=-